jgi:hypothetical protein
MGRAALFIVIAVATAGTANAQTRPPAASGVCERLKTAVDDDLKEISYLYVSGIADDSAPRATMRAADSTAHIAAIQANLTLMSAAHCTMPTTPISPSVYLENALECSLAKDKDEIDAKCARAKWQPSG